MWNVFGYCKEYINNKVDDKEFLDIYDKQHQLKDFIEDMQIAIDENKSASILINKYRLDNDFKSIKSYIKELVDHFEKVNK